MVDIPSKRLIKLAPHRLNYSGPVRLPDRWRYAGLEELEPHRPVDPLIGTELNLSDHVARYQNSRECNTRIYKELDALSYHWPWLSNHRAWVETQQWGFGDRAFHAMWYLILSHLGQRSSAIRCLEIGVYKGQVISLWSLISQHIGVQLQISALSPFSGAPGTIHKNRLFRAIRKRLDRRFRYEIEAGNLYPNRDYFADCEKIFSEFDLDFGKVEIFRGFSTDTNILSSLGDRQFDVIYIDGDHTEEIATHDVKVFAPKVAKGGVLVMDDASLFLEMDVPYRGRLGSSKASELLPAMGFQNILNVGHNRVFLKE